MQEAFDSKIKCSLMGKKFILMASFFGGANGGKDEGHDDGPLQNASGVFDKHCSEYYRSSAP